MTAWLLAGPAAGAEGISARERISLDADWRFLKEPSPAPDGNLLSYAQVKPWLLATGVELAQGAAAAAQVRPAGNPGGGRWPMPKTALTTASGGC